MTVFGVFAAIGAQHQRMLTGWPVCHRPSEGEHYPPLTTLGVPAIAPRQRLNRQPREELLTLNRVGAP
ncbi:MAG: hypothetical protein KGQ93_04235 [Cyanobacteria bacterium REEB459]|nr:hypothetical protein [Cyanobacteria bacterium REEB459]